MWIGYGIILICRIYNKEENYEYIKIIQKSIEMFVSYWFNTNMAPLFAVFMTQDKIIHLVQYVKQVDNKLKTMFSESNFDNFYSNKKFTKLNFNFIEL